MRNPGAGCAIGQRQGQKADTEDQAHRPDQPARRGLPGCGRIGLGHGNRVRHCRRRVVRLGGGGARQGGGGPGRRGLRFWRGLWRVIDRRHHGADRLQIGIVDGRLQRGSRGGGSRARGSNGLGRGRLRYRRLGHGGPGCRGLARGQGRRQRGCHFADDPALFPPRNGRHLVARDPFRIWFEIEAHACDAQAALGVIPKANAEAVWRAKDVEFDVARIDEIEAVTKHDVIAFLTHLAEHIGADEARFVHQGMTSSDVLDTTLNIQLVRAADMLLARAWTGCWPR
jgi:hypothetical protein